VINRDLRLRSAVSDYREFPPPVPLARYLLCLWTQTVTGSRDEFEQRVLPDGCIDIVLINDEAPMVVGPWTEPFVARLAPGTIIIGARCHPGLAPGLLRLPASALLNQSVPLRDVWGGAVAAQFERIADEPDIAARRSAIEAALLNRLARAAPVDQAVSAAIQWLARHPQGRIEELSRWIGFSCRQLQRRFAVAVGYGPKMFQSVLRFQRLLNLANNLGARGSFAQLAAEAEYADQAHMTREVQRFSCNPPSITLQSERCALRLSGLLQTEHGFFS
jgi:AraC-like DNA-binding protein